MKRIFDIIFSAIALLITFPLILICIVIIKLEEPNSPVFYKQKRGGKNKQFFNIYKFRTMSTNAEITGSLTIGNDLRITKSGKWLRKFKIDELPQFFNVLIGDMSVVGPRPEVEKYINLYNEKQLEVLKIKPGITDYASIIYFEENKLLGKSNNPEKIYIEEIMPHKLDLNLQYIKEKSLLIDLKIIIKTLLKVFK
jgi:lipopolysaccharide/colanic/teichoic acid biosynthesis glycosyltransferase